MSLIGFNNIKYGLSLNKKGAASKAQPKKPLAASAFGADEEEEDAEAEIARHAAKKKSKEKVCYVALTCFSFLSAAFPLMVVGVLQVILTLCWLTIERT